MAFVGATSADCHRPCLARKLLAVGAGYHTFYELLGRGAAGLLGRQVLLLVRSGDAPSPTSRYLLTAEFGDYFLFFSVAGTVYLLLAWGWTALFTRYPRKRGGPGLKAVGIFLLGFASVWLTVMLAAFWDGLSPDPFALLHQPGRRMAVLLPWAWSGPWACSCSAAASSGCG